MRVQVALHSQRLEYVIAKAVGQAEWSKVEVKQAFVEAPHSLDTAWGGDVCLLCSSACFQAIILEWTGLATEQKVSFSK